MSCRLALVGRCVDITNSEQSVSHGLADIVSEPKITDMFYAEIAWNATILCIFCHTKKTRPIKWQFNEKTSRNRIQRSYSRSHSGAWLICVKAFTRPRTLARLCGLYVWCGYLWSSVIGGKDFQTATNVGFSGGQTHTHSLNDRQERARIFGKCFKSLSLARVRRNGILLSNGNVRIFQAS